MNDIQQRTAEQLFRTLGELKGGAMKFGQALSVLEAALPEEVAGPYREQLTKLQDSAPPMPTQTVRDILERDLGPDWKDQLVWLDGGPTAAASIGQVHQGRWHDGRDGRRQGAVPRRRRGADVRPQAARPDRPDHRAARPRRRPQAADRGDPGPGGRGARLPARGAGPEPLRRRLPRRPHDRHPRGRRPRRHRAGHRVDGEPLLAWRRSSPRARRQSATTTASCSCGSSSRVRSAPACCTPTRTRGTSGSCPARTAGPAGSASSTSAPSPGSRSAASPRRWAG